jgi:hypothetical protein
MVGAMSSRCPICGFDGSQVSPSDAAVALRSFPRRFTLVLARPDDEDRPDDVVHRRPKSGGLSAIEHGAWVAIGTGQADEAFRAVMYLDHPEVTLPSVDVDPPVPGGEANAETAIARIKGATDPFAAAIQDAPSSGWTRTGRTVDGVDGEITALDVVRLAVHLGVHHLRLAEQTVDEVAHDLG